MNPQTRKRVDGIIWMIFYIIAYVLIVAILFDFLRDMGLSNFSLSFFEVLILVFAVYRLTTILAIDPLIAPLRDYIGGFRASGTAHLKQIVQCPWCAATWITPFVIWLFFFSAFTWILTVILAISGGVGVIASITKRFI